MLYKSLKVIYVKASANHGVGAVPLGAEGNVLIYAEHSLTVKLLVDFFEYGKAIVPLGSVKIVD